VNITEPLVIDAVRAGVLLIADGDALRFKALTLMPSGLAERIKANRSDLLTMLRPASTNGTYTSPDAADVPPCSGKTTTPSIRRYATTDVEVEGGLPPYMVGNDPLTAATARDAAENALILAFAFRLAVDKWRELDGPDAKTDADVLRCVQRDIEAAMTVLGDATAMIQEAAPPAKVSYQVRIGE